MSAGPASPSQITKKVSLLETVARRIFEYNVQLIGALVKHLGLRFPPHTTTRTKVEALLDRINLRQDEKDSILEELDRQLQKRKRKQTEKKEEADSGRQVRDPDDVDDILEQQVDNEVLADQDEDDELDCDDDAGFGVGGDKEMPSAAAATKDSAAAKATGAPSKAPDRTPLADVPAIPASPVDAPPGCTMSLVQETVGSSPAWTGRLPKNEFFHGSASISRSFNATTQPTTSTITCNKYGRRALLSESAALEEVRCWLWRWYRLTDADKAAEREHRARQGSSRRGMAEALRPGVPSSVLCGKKSAEPASSSECKDSSSASLSQSRKRGTDDAAVQAAAANSEVSSLAAEIEDVDTTSDVKRRRTDP
jgi:hypothetical protein